MPINFFANEAWGDTEDSKLKRKKMPVPEKDIIEEDMDVGVGVRTEHPEEDKVIKKIPSPEEDEYEDYEDEAYHLSVNKILMPKFARPKDNPKSFASAFAAARKDPAKAKSGKFKWGGKSYSTQLN